MPVSRSLRSLVRLSAGMLPIAVGLVVWQLLGSDNSAYFPRPSAWWSAMVELWRGGQLMSAVRSTLRTFALATVLTVVLAAVVGIVIGLNRSIDRAVGPLLEFCRALPPPVVIPLAVLFGGFSLRMALSVVIFTSAWPIVLQVRTAARGIPAEVHELARTLRLSRMKKLRSIILPALVPGTLLGARVGAPIILICTLVVELVTNITGLGALLGQAQNQFASAQVYGLLIGLCLLGLLVNGLFGAIERHFHAYFSSASD